MPPPSASKVADFRRFAPAQVVRLGSQLVYWVLHGELHLGREINEIRWARRVLLSSFTMTEISTEQLVNVTGGQGGQILGGIGQMASGVGGALGGVGSLLGGIGQLKVAKAQAEQIRAQTALLRQGGGQPQQQQTQAA